LFVTAGVPEVFFPNNVSLVILIDLIVISEKTSGTLDRPFMPSALTAVVYGLFLLARLHAHGFDASYFVVAGTDHYDVASADPSLRSIRAGAGYDGQYYYRLAIEPFSRKLVDHGIAFSMPAYRQQRILYPLLARIASAGKPALVPVVLILLNYIGLCAIAWIGGAFAINAGRHALWGLAFSLYPGFIFTLSRDLTEIVASSLLLAGLLLLHRSRTGWSVMCLTLAVLGRETALIFTVAILVTKALSSPKASKRRDVLLHVIPVVVYVTWRAYLRWVWIGVRDIPIFGGAIGVPFSGISNLWVRAIADPASSPVIWCVETCLLAFLVVRSLQMFHQHPEFRAEEIALLLYVGLAVYLTSLFWVEDQAFLRVTTEIYLIGSLAMLLDRTAIPKAIGIAWIVAAAFTFRWRVEW
jgi:hypothetical protein